MRGRVDDFGDTQLGRTLPNRRLRFCSIEIAPGDQAFGVATTAPTPA